MGQIHGVANLPHVRSINSIVVLDRYQLSADTWRLDIGIAVGTEKVRLLHPEKEAQEKLDNDGSREIE